jgi:DNA gyrase/topoisomerase IV subunit B
MTTVDDFDSKTDIEHVRDKPDMYIGSIQLCTEIRWVIQDKEENKEEDKEEDKEEEKEDTKTKEEAVQIELDYNPGLEQCVLELLVNASDHVQRCKVKIEGDEDNDSDKEIEPVTKIRIDLEKDFITVFNNGSGIPLEIHPKTKLYVPEMIFGNLRTSSNYDDTQKRTWGGRNGIGAKAANIFSTKFILELQTNGKKYYQEFTNGMRNKTIPKITKATIKGDYTKITYYPDFELFEMESFETNDTKTLIKKRAYDLSAATGKETSIWYNNEKITIKDFTDYMTLFIGNSKKVVYKTDRWEIGFALCPYDQATQISFVNAICTEEGGTHVTHVLDPVLNKITAELQIKSKGVTIKKQYIKDNVIIFIKALIENPAFESQLKKQLKTKLSDFGSRCDIPDDIIKKVAKLGICDNVMEIAKAKEMKDAMKKIDGTKTGRLSDIKKLEDANWAGKDKSMECTLILTEGDSISSDTPLLLKDQNEQILIKNIEDLTNDFQFENGKEYGKSDYEIWTDIGWTKIKHVIRHKTSKKIYRILTHTGCVDVTEDHSLLDENGYKISPNNCKIDDKLLHSFPLFEENRIEIPENYKDLEVKDLWKFASQLKIRYYQNILKDKLIDLLENYINKHAFIFKDNCKISIEEAWVMGLFFADGSCGIYNKNLTWGLSNTDLELLKTSHKILTNTYGNTFTIYTMKTIPSGLTKNCINLKQQYKLCLNGGQKTKFIVEKYRKLFYYKKWKYIDPVILNANREIRQSFFEGYYLGDGQHNLESRMKIDINGKITAQCIYTLCNSLGYQTSINHNYKKPNIYNIGVSVEKLNKDPIIIKKIIELPNEEQYVYDLETENHHFQAGIGQLIVHNSAKSLALNGITSAGGRNKWGVFPLRGKFINIRTATAAQLVKNEEIIAVNRILGLKSGLTDIKKLRYGRVMIMTDSDVDGYHIKGLIINYFTFNWPELVEQGLLECMITPLIKIFKGNKLLNMFYNSNDCKKWLNEKKPVGIIREKYYKGLGTSTAIEAKEYFADLASNRKKYKFNEKSDLPIIIRTFDKDQADERKEWISEYLKHPQEVDYKMKEIQIDYFINRELVQFSTYDNIRSIPNVIDGLKPSQRKILFGCLKKNLFIKTDGSGEIKIAQLSGYISEQTQYHHGEISLQGTMINMAQDFVGSNNLNLLLPRGNFGSRQGGGSDAASPRYIFTALRPEVKILFNETDNQLLNYIEEEGTKIEPDFYVPIIPILLLNGSTGIGTGWSTNIPCFKLEDIIENIKKLMEDEDSILKDMIPYYKGFKGQIIKESNNCWKSVGVIEYIDKNTVEITELPVGMWKEDFKEYLDKLLDSNSIKSVMVNDDDDKKTANDVCYRVKLNEPINKTDLPSLIQFFKLEKNINGTNMVAFDENKVIQKYGSVEDIIWTFYKYRLNFYVKRHRYLKETLEEEIKKVSEKLRFVLLVIDDKIVVFKKKKIEIAEELTKHKFKEHDYLLAMQLYKFTNEEVDFLKKELLDLKEELKILLGTTVKKLWNDDLDKLIIIR